MVGILFVVSEGRMAYALEHKNESERLERQARSKEYSVWDEIEIAKQQIQSASNILDAGCGTGILARAFRRLNPTARILGLDTSSDRLTYARELTDDLNILYDLCSLDTTDLPSGSHQFVGTRYVFEHLANPASVAQEFYRILSEQGHVLVVDFDGIFTGYHSPCDELNEMLNEFRDRCPADLDVGRKIASILVKAGFCIKAQKLSLIHFQGVALTQEKENNKLRFLTAWETIVKVFQSSKRATKFKELYLQYFDHPGSTIFHTKCIVLGQKMPK